MFNLAPVGHGRGTFRLSEIIQLGRVPVYVYLDHPWLPYEGSDISVERLGLYGSVRQIGQILRSLARMNESEVRRMESHVARAAEHYTYNGLMKQIDLFFQHPFDMTHGHRGGYLACSAYRRVTSGPQLEPLR